MTKTWSALCVLVALAARPAPSNACDNVVRRVVDPRVEALQRAEGLLFSAREAAAAQAVAQTHPGVAQYRGSRGSIESRAARVVALALVRTGGNIPGLAGFPASTPARRDAAVAWAVARLRELRDLRPTAAVAQTDYAEALARQPSTRAAGLAMLDDLASRGVVASAHAWALVARAREADRRWSERDTALLRCRAMARAASICQVGAAVAAR